MRSYATDRAVMKEVVEMVAVSVPNRFVRMVIWKSSAIQEFCTRETSALEHFGEHLCRNYTGY